ncbi:hypothetical protein SAMD00019534_062580 [Acytostelium subglobosum LB1]|uniref:hypothetical protein n=1 Tax=Acytostelium subglobosum LB1 TaxID=1410327 RepID=UPI000644D8D0|nr:hypothetical protein SAMD00019534_062580 [Acytostelium subglobosum LB1]GAM23083.1 hypothetical protein SAMD00019534_062580 [Acytostelium subglobosum LB1]|eukprot:XP_012754310.1 hypothetical protein SAMD00019534_062580 [Acytostelium subglobosum LB1]
MTILKTISSLSFNATSMTNGSVSASGMTSFGQSSNHVSGIVGTVGSNLNPAVEGALASTKAVAGTVIATLDGVASSIGL